MPDLPPAANDHHLVGREREQAMLRESLAAALAGRGSLMLIGGEAGIGKTALAEWLLTEATERGALALVGRCYDLAETPPYGPWAEALDRARRAESLPPDPDFGGGGAASQMALFAHVRDYLAALATTRPVVLLLEDLHWADPASLDLLRSLARQLAALPIIVLATYRADELTRRHPLYALLPLLVREARAARLDLRPLGEEGLRALAGGYALPPGDEDRLVAYLAAHAEGNPFYTGELLRALEEEGGLRRAGAAWQLGEPGAAGVPPLLRQVIDARVDRLGEAARALLEVAAVLGQEVPLALWRAVADAGEGALVATVERATATHLLAETADGQGVRFAHALVREALYEGTLALRRHALHRRAAEALLATADPGPDAVASHLERAGDARAAEWLVRAGERAWRGYAWLTAAARYEAALALAEQGGMAPGERAALLLTLAQFWRYEDRHRGVGYLDEAERLATEAGDSALVAAVRFDRAHLRLLAQNARAVAERAASLAAMAAALPALEALAPADRARLPALVLQGVGGEELYHRGALMYWLVSVGRLAEAVALGAPMAARGPGTTARGLAALGIASYQLGRPEEAEHTLAESQAAFHAAGQQVEVFYRLMERAENACTYYLDQPARWRHLLAEMEEAVRRAAGAGRMQRDAAMQRLLVVRGEWGDYSGAKWDDYWGANWAVATIALRQGKRAVALAEIGWFLPHGLGTEPGSHSLRPALAFQQLAADLALDAGDLPTAHAWLACHDRWLAQSGAVLGRAEGQLGWAASHRASGDAATARAHAEAALAHAAAPRQPLALLAAHRLLGELDTDAGRHTEAAAHLAAALALADACAAPYERALTLLALAALHAAAGSPGEASTALEQARALLAPLAAAPALARADALAARLAAPVAAPAALPFGLTAREAEVLALVAEGLSDAEVAARLFLSPYTVKAHLRAVYGKLAVPSRTAAARLARDHGLA